MRQQFPISFLISKTNQPRKKVDTVFFWNNNLKDFQPVISLAVVRELSATPDSKWKKRLLRFVSDIKTLEVNQGMVALAEKYVKARLFPQNYSADAVHLAVATAHKVDFF